MAENKCNSGKQEDISRRTFFQRIAALAIGAAAFTSLAPHFASAQTKMAQKAAQYRDTPNGEKTCEKCVLFIAPDGCKMVEGKINPQGWCMLYSQK